MSWLRNLLTKSPLRGRVHRMSVTKSGEVSIVVRFGLDEPRARQLNQGALLDCVPHTAGKAADAIRKQRTQGKQRKQMPSSEYVIQTSSGTLGPFTVSDGVTLEKDDQLIRLPPKDTP